MVSQILYGEGFEVLEEHKTWKRIKLLHDGYEGWLEHLAPFPELNGARQITLSSPAILDANKGQLHLQPGSLLSQSESKKPSGKEIKGPEDVGDFAKQYLGSPYLWGGRTLQGIDCSGFIQLIGRFAKKALPRDAYQQAEIGETIDVANALRGDVAFFKNDKGRITHVGMLLSSNEIIHASEWVRIDSFSSAGIFRHESSKLTHTFSHIKRIF